MSVEVRHLSEELREKGVRGEAGRELRKRMTYSLWLFFGSFVRGR